MLTSDEVGIDHFFVYRILNLLTMVDNDQVTSRLTLSPGELPLARPRRLSAPPSAGEDIKLLRERVLIK